MADKGVGRSLLTLIPSEAVPFLLSSRAEVTGRLCRAGIGVEGSPEAGDRADCHHSPVSGDPSTQPQGALGRDAREFKCPAARPVPNGIGTDNVKRAGTLVRIPAQNERISMSGSGCYSAINRSASESCVAPPRAPDPRSPLVNSIKPNSGELPGKRPKSYTDKPAAS